MRLSALPCPGGARVDGWCPVPADTGEEAPPPGRCGVSGNGGHRHVVCRWPLTCAPSSALGRGTGRRVRWWSHDGWDGRRDGGCRGSLSPGDPLPAAMRWVRGSAPGVRVWSFGPDLGVRSCCPGGGGGVFGSWIHPRAVLATSLQVQGFGWCPGGVMRLHSTGAVLAAMVMALTGCGTPDTDPAPSPEPSPSESASAEPTAEQAAIDAYDS